MRVIGQLETEPAARRFSDFLAVQRIPNQIEAGNNNRWDIWVHSDDDLAKAGELLRVFQANPNDPQFKSADRVDEVRAEEERAQEAFEKRLKTRGQLFRRFVAYGMGPLTALLMGICIAVFVLSEFSKNLERVHMLFFSELYADPRLVGRLLSSPEIRTGEVWRLFTPMFLHFGILHIFFNMMWLRELGGMIETIEGSLKFLALVFISALISNWAEYVVTGHPLFGGMSGVVYALLGYVWMKGKYHPGSGLYLHKQTVVMMLVWLVVCFTGWLGPIANYAHLGGLIVGVVWGFLASRR